MQKIQAKSSYYITDFLKIHIKMAVYEKKIWRRKLGLARRFLMRDADGYFGSGMASAKRFKDLSATVILTFLARNTTSQAFWYSPL